VTVYRCLNQEGLNDDEGGEGEEGFGEAKYFGEDFWWRVKGEKVKI
jgi:hypothetical protein